MWATEASQEVHLTFDDGPHPDITPWVLTCLEERQMTATFFVIGHHAQTHGAACSGACARQAMPLVATR